LVFDRKAVKELLQIGAPTGLSWSVIFIFNFLVASAMGRISTVALAAYQIVYQWSSLFFIITYCLSIALSIRIGIAIVSNTASRLKSSMISAILINMVYMSFIAILFLALAQWLIRFDLDNHTLQNQEITKIALTFFKFSVIYLFFETIRFLFSGALLGLKDTFYNLKVGIFTWLLIGAPAIYLAPKFFANDTIVYWIIMIICEALGLVILARRYLFKQKLLAN
jgi:MATE family multidrug resistance protein